MAGGIIGGALATHTPRLAAQEPAFLAELAGGARLMGEPQKRGKGLNESDFMEKPGVGAHHGSSPPHPVSTIPIPVR